MSEPPATESPPEQTPADGAAERDEALPVLVGEAAVVRPGASARAVEWRSAPMLPAVQAAAAAAGGFVAGAAVVGLVHRRRRSRALAGRSRGELRRGSRRRAPSAGELVQIVGSRSLLVDVHLLGGSGRGS